MNILMSERGQNKIFALPPPLDILVVTFVLLDGSVTHSDF